MHSSRLFGSVTPGGAEAAAVTRFGLTLQFGGLIALKLAIGVAVFLRVLGLGSTLCVVGLSA